MRKTILTALVVLLLMLAVSCDNIPTGQNEDGLVTVKVNTGGTVSNSRSLTIPLAHKEGNYVEVIFKSGTGATVKYYSAGSILALAEDPEFGLSIKIPVGTYDSTNALLLIGRSTDGTLLATGTITTPTFVVADGDPIEFEVVSLEADISATGSAFYIEESSGAPAYIAVGNDGAFAGNTKKGIFIDDISTCFQVPTATSNIDATLTIDGLVATGANIFVTTDTSVTTPVIFKPLTIGSVTPPAIASTNNLVADSALPGVITIKFNVTTPGPYLINFMIPVIGFDPPAPSDTDNRRVWFIRGGTKKGPDLEGRGEEGIPLLVTAKPTTLVAPGITITYPDGD